MRWVPRASRWVLGLASLLSVETASALDADEARERVTVEVGRIQLAVAAISERGSTQRTQTEAERLATGEMLLRTRDHDAAIDELNKLIELHAQGKVSENTYADALFLLAGAYFDSDQLLSARRHYREILRNQTRGPFTPHLGKALSRLVDIAVRTDDRASLDETMATLGDFPAGIMSASLSYARAKVLFAQGRYAEAFDVAAQVPMGSVFRHRADYLAGVIRAKEDAAAAAKAPPGPAKELPFRRAIEQFRRVTQLPAVTAAQRGIVDLAWMALGRLYYEGGQLADALRAYSHVKRGSAEFSNMLYELAWVHIRLEDYRNAERTLEVLAITNPDNVHLADGSLLRADLMLRAGKLDRAVKVYRGVRAQFDPIRDEVARFLASTSDPAAYYDKLTQDELLAEVKGGALSPTVLKWAREEAEDDRLFGVVDDVTRSRYLVRDSRRMVQRLNAALSVRSSVKAFPRIKVVLATTLALLNQVTRARGYLAAGLDDVADSPAPELQALRGRRQNLMRALGSLPITSAQFARRDEVGDMQWNRVSQKLQRLTLEADRLGAVVNGFERVLQDASGGVTNSPLRQQFDAEIQANRRDLAMYNQQITQFRDAMEMGRAQIGFGDQRYINDANLRRQFRDSVAQELNLTASGRDSEDAAEYARAVFPLWSKLGQLEQQLELTRASYEKRGAAEARQVLGKVASEARTVENGSRTLDTLDHEARLLVGTLAMKNFGLVRDRLRSIVLRADVGVTHQAWEKREEALKKMLQLQRDRAREEQLLNDELSDVIEEGGTPPGGSP